MNGGRGGNLLKKLINRGVLINGRGGGQKFVNCSSKTKHSN